MARNFQTKLEDGFIALPFDVREEFGRARPPVTVSINGYSYRSTVCVYGGKYFIPVRKSNQEAAGVKPGDAVRAKIALDEEPRIVEPTPDLQAALKKSTLNRRLGEAQLQPKERVCGCARSRQESRNSRPACAKSPGRNKSKAGLELPGYEIRGDHFIDNSGAQR